MKKKKLQLDSLEVNSFTTKLSDDEQVALNGGTNTTTVIASMVSPIITPSFGPPTPVIISVDLAETKNGDEGCGPGGG